MPYPGKFTVKQRRMICYWFAENSAPSRVATLCEETWGLKVNPYKLYEHYASSSAPLRWRQLIRQYRHLIERRVVEIPIAKKAIRLAMLNQAARECLVFRTRQVGEFGVIQEMKLGVLPAIIREARNELEDGKPSGTQCQRPHAVDVVEGLRQIAERRKQRLAALESASTNPHAATPEANTHQPQTHQR